jgi:hypothetical protein
MGYYSMNNLHVGVHRAITYCQRRLASRDVRELIMIELDPADPGYISRLYRFDGEHQPLRRSEAGSFVGFLPSN